MSVDHAAAGPRAATPVRRPWSVRRTTSHDLLRPDGLLAPVTMVAVGRDVRTGGRGDVEVLDSARLEGVFTFPERVVRRLELVPAGPPLAGFVGESTRSGFRRRLEAQVPPEERRGVAYQLLDDVPTAVLVSGVAIHSAGVVRDRPPGAPAQPPDLCAGFVSGGTLQLALAAGDGVPRGRPRPPAPALTAVDDPQAWHALDPLPPHSVRRVRRLDVWRDGTGITADAFFRDSHTDEAGRETVVHEYAVRAGVDPATATITACAADHGALPWPECPAALGSAGRLVGMRADEVRSRVRDELTGPSTCTHLNDVLRSLAALPALLDVLPPPVGGRR